MVALAGNGLNAGKIWGIFSSSEVGRVCAAVLLNPDINMNPK